MGLGKTVQVLHKPLQLLSLYPLTRSLALPVKAIAVAAYFRADWPMLVVCPSSLRIQWAQQFGAQR